MPGPDNPNDELEMQTLSVDNETAGGIESGGGGGGGEAAATVSGSDDGTSGGDDRLDEDQADGEDQDDTVEQGASLYFAACQTGSHRPWEGPQRQSRDAAQSDADAHNQTCDAKGAVVI
jgi:hypothetical protein